MDTKNHTLKELAELMNVLSVESRLRIIDLLREYESLCVNAIACHLEISQSAVSQHLKILHFSGFVSSRRDGYYTHYRLNREKLDNSIELLTHLTTRPKTIKLNKCTPKGDKPCADVKKNARNRKI
ncbi:MAG: metalloregulator ArsR/SmtB family transcription factor [Candidatus Aegiribacteria sp.]|nr:metalloregulator ArsR/SmtB family transcription factor [Candidatus Aegiribacteria sp.]